MAASLREQARGTLRVGTILEPEFTRLGPFVRSLATSLQKTEVFLRYDMSDDVLMQIGKGELDVGYYIDAAPLGASAPPPASERSISDGKFQLAPLTRYDYRVIAPLAWSDKILGKGWADVADLPWLATPPHSAHRRLTDDIFRSFGALPKRVAFTDQEEAVIDFVESGVGLGLARDGILDRITRKRDFVVADHVALTCDLSFACLAARRHEEVIARAFSAMQAVWDLAPSGA
jgi:DNA-binding transcriptional LysR family regulator